MLHKEDVDRSKIYLGKTGEEIAELFLKTRGFKILERNFRTLFGEIDIVALENRTIVFIEVKTRVSRRFGPPSLSIIKKKKKSIIKNAMYYLKRFRLSDVDARIDVISINMDEEGDFEKLEHIRSAIWIE